jgi:hypothetical protein
MIIIIIVIGVLNLFFCTSCQMAVFWYIQFSTGVHSPIRIMCVVLITVTFCSSVADWWPGSNWRFWSNPFLTVPDAPFITGTIFVLTFSTSCWPRSAGIFTCLVFQFLSSGTAISIGRQVFSFLSCSTVSGRFADCLVCDNRLLPHRSGTIYVDICDPCRHMFIVFVCNL